MQGAPAFSEDAAVGAEGNGRTGAQLSAESSVLTTANTTDQRILPGFAHERIYAGSPRRGKELKRI